MLKARRLWFIVCGLLTPAVRPGRPARRGVVTPSSVKTWDRCTFTVLAAMNS
jgi:hypothetical protein